MKILKGNIIKFAIMMKVKYRNKETRKGHKV